jgi:hypothetical protein
MNWLAPLLLALSWLGQWLVLLGLLSAGVAAPLAAALAAAPGLLFLRPGAPGALGIKILKACVFPVSLLLVGSLGDIPLWIWPLALLGGAMVFPKLGRGDAPLWRTPRATLSRLAAQLPVTPRSVLDAGCGIGDALAQAAIEWPHAQLTGIEASLVLRVIARARVGRAIILAGDLWTTCWSDAQLVYLYLRPEAMDRALNKARCELSPEAWVASLEFELPAAPEFSVRLEDGRSVWVYRVASLAESIEASDSERSALASPDRLPRTD